MEYLLLKSRTIYSTIRSNQFHTSGYLNGSRQTGIAMRKMLGATKKKKSYFNDTPSMPTPDVFSKGSYEGRKSGNSRRASVLNKLFMRHITDQMATGECSSEILGHGIEINRVQVTPDYKHVRVYWMAKGTQDDKVVDAVLRKSAGSIRHELSQLRIMGVVPNIQFMRDKNYANIVELDSRIAVADFGEDHVPLNFVEKLKTDFEILGPLDDKIKEKLKELEFWEERDESEDLPLPPMPQNVLGLNHAEILEKVKKSMKKSEALHRQSSTNSTEDSWVTFKLSQPTNEDPVNLGSEKSQRAVFKEFLQKRQLERLKANRENKNYIPDLEYIREELIERHKNNLSRFDLIENSEEDFIDEDLDQEIK